MHPRSDFFFYYLTNIVFFTISDEELLHMPEFGGAALHYSSSEGVVFVREEIKVAFFPDFCHFYHDPSLPSGIVGYKSHVAATS